MPDYVDFAEYYDEDHAITFDVNFYLDFARGCQPPILELACGTGRLLIPLAEAGLEVYGFDLSENMLARCRQKVAQRHLENRVYLRLGDMASFDLPRHDFGLAFAGLRSFMHLLTRRAQRACLERVFLHLQPGGIFIVDVIAPDPERLKQAPGVEFMVRREFALPNEHRVIRKDRLAAHDSKNQVRQFEFIFEEYDRAGTLVRERQVPLFTRYIFRDELQGLLETSGFEIAGVYRDYDRDPYDGSGEMIFVAQRPTI
jgi:SAM-dependent methyltransferase